MSEPILRVRDLSVDFHVEGSQVHAVKNVSFDLSAGETLAIVGESGSGKSVTALSVLQLLPYPTASHPSGSIEYRGMELIGANEATMRHARGNNISMIFQEPMTALNPLHVVETQIGEVLSLHKKMTAGQSRSRVLELLHLVGIQEPEKRLKSYPHQLSGGQRQRVMIAMALANEPDILIADEPTTALDVTIQAQILDLLKELQTKLGMGMILITHNLGIVRRMADRVVVMTGGEIVEQAVTDDLFHHPQHPYTMHLLRSELDRKPAGRPDEAKTVLTAKNLRVWFPIKSGIFRRTVDHIRAVDEVSLEVREGHTVGVVGESGSGKTTLGLALLRLISSKGTVQFQGTGIDTFSSKVLRPLRRQMQIVFQDPFSSLSPRMSIAQIIEEGLLIHGEGGDNQERRALIARILKEVGIDPSAMDRFPHEFSGGQRQRVAIARAMVLQPRFVVLDEPTSALDVSVQAQIVNLLRDLQQRHRLAYLFISHDLKVVRALADEVIVLRNGKVMEQGKAEQIFTSPQTDYTKALMAAAFDLAATDTGAVSS